MVKKLLTAIVGATVLAVGVPAVSFASPIPNPAVTAVTGTVTLQGNGSQVNGANVTVNCNGNFLTDVTDGTGAYEVDYTPASLCPVASTASVSATRGNLSGSNSSSVSNATPQLNIALVDVPVVPVPEMGIVTGVSAAVIGAGAFMVIRRNKLGSQQF